MARPVFWPTNDSLVLSVGGYPQASIPVKIYTRQSGGTQVTDLLYVGYDGTLGSAVPSGVLTSDSNGLIPAFAGPDSGPTTLWADHGMSGERLALTSDPTGTGGGGGAVSSVVGQTGAVTGTQILADSTVSAALTLKAPLASPTFTGTPVVPTATAGTNTTQAASTAFVTTAVAAGGVVASVVGQTGAVTGTQILADSTVSAVLALKAPLASPALTGTPTVPTAAAGTSTTQAASTAFTAAAANPTTGSDNWLKLHAGGNLDALIVGVITRDGNGAATAAGVVWPDGTTGAYASTTVSTAFPGAVDAYTVTYVGGTTKTVTQSAVTRNGSGAVTTRPAMTVS